MISYKDVALVGTVTPLLLQSSNELLHNSSSLLSSRVKNNPGAAESAQYQRVLCTTNYAVRGTCKRAPFVCDKETVASLRVGVSFQRRG